ncbi:hypothetical protein [Buttiauxella noackiae]|uniref:hypothetical protein n=1 Tax=Buttiauxella noackiae TaxID=82992 RepID=UPI0005589DD4|nr:hypothetical protein [Buttiauxella noackiae]
MENPSITVIKGQSIIFDAPENANTANLLDSDEKYILQVHGVTNGLIELPTASDEIKSGKYVVTVEDANGVLLAVQPVKIRGLFEKENRAETLREQISLLDKVITAKLSDDQGVLQQLSINNKTLVYSTLADLIALVDSLRAQLSNEIEKANRKKGRAPFRQVKLILRG